MLSPPDFVRTIVIYEQHLCDVANMLVELDQSEKLKEIDKLFVQDKNSSLRMHKSHRAVILF